MKNGNLLFLLAIIGITFLTALTFIAARLLFADQPGIENVFSLIWTGAMLAALYKIMRYLFPGKKPGEVVARQDMYGALVFVCELIAVLVMLFSAIFLAITLTSDGGGNTQIAMIVGVMGVMALAVPLGVRLIRMLMRRNMQTQSRMG
jgi:drug/metabolite transporter (DMT)-like permease